MKGVSPLVAAVLLIAVTMSIAGILAYWASQFVSRSLPEVNETTAQCKFTNFIIYSCFYNSTTSKLAITLNNIQQVEVKQLVTYLVFPDGTMSSGIKLNETLAPGEFRSYILSDIPSDFSKIIVTTQLCPDISKEDSCRRV